MAVLHIVNKSPTERNSLTSCLGHAEAGAGILLIEDGVYGAVDNTVTSDAVKALKDVKVFVLAPDLDARGMGGKALIDGVEQVDYAGFVDLVEKFDVSQSWV